MGSNYTNEYFLDTKCPKCLAKGNFHKHAYYQRTIIYLEFNQIIEEKLTILRIKCLSCKSTHAVLPYDIIPYRIFNVEYILKLLIMLYVCNLPLITIVEFLKMSYQLFYQYRNDFLEYIVQITSFFRTINDKTPPSPSKKNLVILITSQDYESFLFKYFKHNGRPFFIKKFYNNLSPLIYFGMTKNPYSRTHTRLE